MNKYLSTFTFLLLSLFANDSWAEIIIDDSGNKYITLGSTKDEVIEVLGTPSRISASLNWWYYDGSRIAFDDHNRLEEYTNAKALKISLIPQSHKTKSEEISSNPTSNSTSIIKTITSGSTSASSYIPSSSGYGEISEKTGRPKTVHVDGYYRKDGTYVKPHYRSSPRRK